jgi:hypothetical protein
VPTQINQDKSPITSHKNIGEMQVSTTMLPQAMDPNHGSKTVRIRKRLHVRAIIPDEEYGSIIDLDFHFN